eukprot:tig00020616_g12247.t1
MRASAASQAGAAVAIDFPCAAERTESCRVHFAVELGRVSLADEGVATVPKTSFIRSHSPALSWFAHAKCVCHFQRGLQLSLGLRAQLFAEEALVTILYGFHAGLEKQRPAFLVVLRAQARVVVLQGRSQGDLLAPALRLRLLTRRYRGVSSVGSPSKARRRDGALRVHRSSWCQYCFPVPCTAVRVPLSPRRGPRPSAPAPSAPADSSCSCSASNTATNASFAHFTFRARQGARPWLTRALLPAASGSLFCSVPLGAPMYRSCQGRGRDAEDGSWDAPPRAREFPRASSLEMGAFRNSVGSRGTQASPAVRAPDCVIRRRGGEVPVGHELQAVRDAGLHYGLDKVAGLVRGLRSCIPRGA